MSKDLSISFLFDCYGKMLTEKQQETIDSYYNADLSLSEISQNEGITRQGVRDSIKRAEALLKEMETKLKFVSKTHRLQSIADSVRNSINNSDDDLQNDIIKHILNLCDAVDTLF